MPNADHPPLPPDVSARLDRFHGGLPRTAPPGWTIVAAFVLRGPDGRLYSDQAGQDEWTDTTLNLVVGAAGPTGGPWRGGLSWRDIRRLRFRDLADDQLDHLRRLIEAQIDNGAPAQEGQRWLGQIARELRDRAAGPAAVRARDQLIQGATAGAAAAAGLAAYATGLFRGRTGGIGFDPPDALPPAGPSAPRTPSGLSPDEESDLAQRATAAIAAAQRLRTVPPQIPPPFVHHQAQNALATVDAALQPGSLLAQLLPASPPASLPPRAPVLASTNPPGPSGLGFDLRAQTPPADPWDPNPSRGRMQLVLDPDGGIRVVSPSPPPDDRAPAPPRSPRPRTPRDAAIDRAQAAVHRSERQLGPQAAAASFDELAADLSALQQLVLDPEWQSAIVTRAMRVQLHTSGIRP